ncbi:ankyrin repeat domain-containing protein [bacterium]|nr:ankyrin repeat domain-containing protein [bacterium]
MKIEHFTILILLVFTGCASTPRIDIQKAAATGDLTAISAYIEAGSDLNKKDYSTGSTPLMTAITFDRFDSVKTLLEGGADVNYRNTDGSTALHIAAFFCHADIVELLINHGADRNAVNNDRVTALQIVTIPYEKIKGVYDKIAEAMEPTGLIVNQERIKADRPKIAEILKRWP